MDWAFVLVIILSCFLAVFIALGIFLVVLLIKVTLQIKKVTNTAERTAGNMETLINNASKVVSPLLLGRALLKHAKKLTKRKD